MAFHRKLTCQTPVYTLSFPCTCIRILSLSRGATAVRDLQQYLQNSLSGDGQRRNFETSGGMKGSMEGMG